MGSQLSKALHEDVLACFEEAVRLRRDFHENPELGYQEFRTSKIVEEYLQNLGIETRRCASTGVIGILKGNSPGKTVMIRADIDALPVTEQTNLPFKSKNDGVMHACGHDGHTSILLMVAKILAKRKEYLQGTIKFVFQPNEEDAGAEDMIADGVLKDPVPDVILGQHLWSPIKTGRIGLVSGPIMASSYYFDLKIIGKGGHGGAPHKAVNPINAGVEVVQNLLKLTPTEFDVLKPTLISIGKFKGGSKNIIIPDTVEIAGSVRCLHNDDEAVRNRMKEIISSICTMMHCTYELSFKCGNSVLDNNDALAQICREAAKETVGEENIVTKDVSVMLGDDFAEFLRDIPGMYYFVGTANEEKGTNYEHHHAKFDIDEDSMLVAIEMQLRMAIKALEM